MKDLNQRIRSKSSQADVYATEKDGTEWRHPVGNEKRN
jgi:hypothetical protein